MTDEKEDKVLEAIRHLRVEMRKEQVETRAHIGNEVATVRNDAAITKNFMGRVLTAVKKLLSKMGIASDDL